VYPKIAFLQMNFICELAEVKVKPRWLHEVLGQSLIQLLTTAEQGLTSLIVQTEVTYGTLIMNPGGSWDHGLVSKNAIS